MRRKHAHIQVGKCEPVVEIDGSRLPNFHFVDIVMPENIFSDVINLSNHVSKREAMKRARKVLRRLLKQLEREMK